MPSGRHVGIDTQPLSDLFDRWHEDASREQLDRLNEVNDLLPYVRILELLPAEGAHSTLLSPAQGSAQLPSGFVARDSGRRLHDWPAAFADWPAADRSAFQTFVDERVYAYLDSVLAETNAKNNQRTKAFLSRLESIWVKAGVHPSQEPGWDDLPDSPDLDEYDAMVALGQCCSAISANAAGLPERTHAVDRLEVIWEMACSRMEWLPHSLDPLAPTAGLAQLLRDGNGLARLPAERRTWWRTQLLNECQNLFDDAALEQFFMEHAPKAWGVVKTIALSPPSAAR